MNLLEYALPLFFLSIFLEVFWSKKKKKSVYRLNDSLSDISCGILEVVVKSLVGGLFYGGYVFIQQNFSLTSLFSTNTAFNWILLFILFDFLYYFFHRLSHRVNLIWAAHIVHHSSEEYNLSVALRQGPFQFWFSYPIYYLLGLLGFDPKMFLTVASIVTLYQFWIHTKLIGNLGPFERVLNTPKHHQVHHGRDAKYWDKNYGGMLIIWDRLFGTFYQNDSDEIEFGVDKNVESFNPFWTIFSPWINLRKRFNSAPAIADKLKLLISPPSWSFPGEELEISGKHVKYDPIISEQNTKKATYLFVAALVHGIYLLFYGYKISLSLKIASAIIIVIFLAIGGSYLDEEDLSKKIS